jgi:large subunit ribosomal protein L35
MPKLKTKKGVAKRFKLTKKRKVVYKAGGKSHLATGKEPERLRYLRRSRTVRLKKALKYLRRELPYG